MLIEKGMQSSSLLPFRRILCGRGTPGVDAAIRTLGCVLPPRRNTGARFLMITMQCALRLGSLPSLAGHMRKEGSHHTAGDKTPRR